MQVNFDNIDVAINNSGIIATNASLNTNNAMEAAYAIGYTKPLNQLPYGPINTSFDVSYLPVIDQEPNFAIINRLKNLTIDNEYLGERIEFAGLYHDYWFLNNYGLKIQPHNVVEASTSYQTFWQLCGAVIREKSNRINYLDEGSCWHSWSTYILSSGDYINKPVYEFTYNFQADWRPIYIIGKKFPVEVKLLGIRESISFNIDEFKNVLLTGEDVYPNMFSSNNGELQFRNLSIICSDGCDATGEAASPSLSLNISGFKIQSVNPVASVGQMLRVNYLANRYN